MSWLVYLLECSDNTLYCGITNNLEKRLKAHNTGKGAKYTRCRLPVKIIFQQAAESKSEASKLEFRIKQLTRREKLELVQNDKSSL